MYSFTISAHSIWRWVVIAVALFALFRSLISWRNEKAWTKKDSSIAAMFTGILDLQVLLGFMLYFGVSPIMKAAFRDFSTAMKADEIRYFMVEHMPIMLLAAVFAHIGARAGKQDLDDKQKWQRVSIWFALAAIAILFGTPWFRPLLPSF